MNYIKQLQQQVSSQQTQITCALEEVQAFRAHLASDKFRGTDTEKHICPRCQWDSYTEERKDWIATADVHEWLRRIEEFLK
jgi:hypothetical protein